MYRNQSIILLIVAFLSLASTAFPADTRDKQTLTLLMGAAASYNVTRAISQVLEDPGISGHVTLHYYTEEDLADGKIDQEVINESGIIILDDMYRTLSEYILENANFKTTKVYGLSTVPNNPEKIISDPGIKQYARPLTRKNISNLICFLLKREYGLATDCDPPQIVPKTGIFHPQSDRIFESFEAYFSWYKSSGLYKEKGFWVGIPEMNTYVYPGETGYVVRSLIEKLEANQINVLPVYSYPPDTAVGKYFYDEKSRKSRVNLIAAMSYKFAPSSAEKTRKLFAKFGVPVLNPIRVHFLTIPQWENDPQGLGPMEVTYAMSNPEVLGLIEPSAIGGRVASRDKQTGKDVYTYQPIEKNIDFFIQRINAWRRLQSTPNKDKKIAIMFWNHTPGKQNIGATYLNLFRSLEEILQRLSKEGYHVAGNLPSEEEIKNLILASGRNIGSWASGELDALISKGQAIRLPFERYKQWYQTIDPEYKKKVEKDWGRVEDSKIMTRNQEIIFPCIPLGNIILIPQPSRGWHDDPIKLYHSTKLMPHHQYTAFYLWLKNEFKADAIVSFGTHGSHEWLPGKQAGLSQSCSPEVLIQDIPNIYPYVMDDIGEGIQAKRRGRGVIIDYLIPAMKKAGTYEEYGELGGLISEYNDTLSRSPELANQKYKRIEAMAAKLGLLEDLMIKKFDEASIEAVEHYLLELQEANLPYGLHTFGTSPTGEALEEFSQLIHERNDTFAFQEIKKNLSLCNREMDHLIKGLDGGYIPSAEANDPLRNPEAIPTGNNFYGFDPAKVPSKDAWNLGKTQADQMIEKYVKENKTYPEKIGLVFWSIELQRNEGTQVGTALHLLGMKPVWDKNNKVIGVEPIPGTVLGRPRIDVHMQVSGLFRDNFPTLILLMDEAVRKAGQLKDVDNFIAVHNQKIKAYLLEKGYDEKEADQLKQLRVFSNELGSYGNTIEDLIPNSGLWEGDDEIADVFINFVSFGYGKGVWGKPLKSAYKKNLEDVKMTMHTRSSNLFMNLDTDGVFSELGGLALAVKRVSGVYPDVVLSNQMNPDAAYVEDIEKTIGKELRSRYLNPKWIEGMKKENYAGAREMNRFVEHLWGWQVTTPFAVDGAKWEQIYEVYIQDKYGMELKSFFNKHNPWARQSMAARMLEADRKEYWKAPEEIKKDLARTYALNVIEKGVACCEHTCNNPMLQKFVTNIISLHGLLTPKELEQFKMVIAKAVGKTQAEHEAEHAKTREGLKEPIEKNQQEETIKAKTQGKQMKGFEMVEEKMEETKVTSSGSSWMVMVIVIGIIGLVALGWKRKKI
ncbi:cobaltochelatase subunit CobN [Desulfobacula phenolica]|uniref:Cobaltochelatase CobN n=1 Tax=Desulfobacula phenolica TaxID=90732 RepID=A0A1H2HKH7_9BACT|nr:cobaltochelatase subunit CobN [Desulfobacula phenolica]SDU32380.1 cobaltochelatase CobN [Desulfobacula phenolica]